MSKIYRWPARMSIQECCIPALLKLKSLGCAMCLPLFLVMIVSCRNRSEYGVHVGQSNVIRPMLPVCPTAIVLQNVSHDGILLDQAQNLQYQHSLHWKSPLPKTIPPHTRTLSLYPSWRISKPSTQLAYISMALELPSLEGGTSRLSQQPQQCQGPCLGPVW